MTSIAIYDPRRLNETDFLAGFVARGELVAFLLKQLQLTATDREGRHRLVLGQRGMGKTSLLRRLEIGITDDPALAAALLPLSFREEQYNVRSLHRFWRNCGEALAEWLEKSGDAAGAAQLDAEMRGPAWQDNETAATAFLERVALTGRRAVLLLDNFDLVLDALPDKQHWQLRRVLQAAGGPIVYGGATQAPRQSGDQHAAFYEFFRFDALEPLTMPEVMTCLRSLAVNRGEIGKPVLEILQHKPERLRVLHSLTGGNPRILALLYQLLERAESETVFEDLEGLLDQLTPLYKARVEELRTELQRSILDAIALHWDPITSHVLAANTQVEITTISSQLLKLKSVGLIEEVPTSGARAGYQLVERFFNVWYLIRYGTRRTKERIDRLPEFLGSFYRGEDFRPLPVPGSTAVPLGGIAAAAKAMAIRPGFGFKEPEGEHLLLRYDTDEDVERRLREATRRNPTDATPWVGLGNLLTTSLHRHSEAVFAYDEAIRIDPSCVDAWANRGAVLTKRLGRHEDAEVSFREAVKIDPGSSAIWSDLGNLLADHLGRLGEAEGAYLEAVRLSSEHSSTQRNLFWLRVAVDQVAPAAALRGSLATLDDVGLHLMDAALALAADNFGATTAELAAVLRLDLNPPCASYFDDLLRLLRLFERRGYGERLIAWFEATGHADRHAPIYAALVAYVRGATMLRDVNPETRPAAERIYAWLASHRAAEVKVDEPRRRGRPRRVR